MPRHPKLTWEQAQERFLTHLRGQNCSKRTVYCYGLEVARLAAFARPRLPHEVTRTDLSDYQAGLLAGTASRSGKPLSGRTVYRVACTLASFFAWMCEQDFVGVDPSARHVRPKTNQPRPGSVLTVEEAEALLAAAASTTATGLRDRALLELLYATGVRRDELLNLDLTSFNTRERLLHVLGKGPGGGKYRVLPVARAAALRIEQYLQEARPRLVTPASGSALFLTRFGRRIGPAVPAKLLHRLAGVAGIDKAVTPHTLRRTFATHMLKNDASLRHIQLVLGHEKLTTTAVYLCLDSEELRREILLHHPRERFDP